MDVSMSNAIHFGLRSLSASIYLPPSAIGTIPVADRPSVVETAMDEENRAEIRKSPLIGDQMIEPALGDHLGRNIDMRV